MIAVIMAGGMGTRIRQRFPHIPKPMMPIDGIPLLEQTILTLRKQNIRDFILTVGYKAEHIMSYFEDGSGTSPTTGEPFDVHIRYIIEKEPMGNAWALQKAHPWLKEDFLLVNGDLLFDMDMDRFIRFHQSHQGLATIVTHPNDHPYDSQLIVADENHVVQDWIGKKEKRPEFYQNRVNAGIHILSPTLLLDMHEERPNLDSDILKPLAGTGFLYAYDSPEYVKDAGTPERYDAVCRDVRQGIVKAGNLKNPQKAVFLDRDGVINQYVGFLRKPEEFVLLPGVAEKIREFHQMGYLVIVVTNQPVIARGEVSFSQLREIHNKMETLLGEEHAYIDGLYFCPHHPHAGFPGERKELKTECSCRKPKPGMLLQAAKDFHIDLKNSYMIGDSWTDVEAGKAAGCQTILLSHHSLKDVHLKKEG